MSASEYATLGEIKARLGISDTADDSTLAAVLTAVSREIDQVCKRRFYVTNTDEIRYFMAQRADLLDAGDLVSVTSLATDPDGDRSYSETWAATDYDLSPYNAALDSMPYLYIEVAPSGNYEFPCNVGKGVKVIGKWGWPDTPAAVREACLIQSSRIFRRKDAIFGVTGSAEMGQMMVIPRLDPDVRLLLEAFEKKGFW